MRAGLLPLNAKKKRSLNPADFQSSETVGEGAGSREDQASPHQVAKSSGEHTMCQGSGAVGANKF